MNKKLIEGHGKNRPVASLVKWEDKSMTVVVTANNRLSLFETLNMITNPSVVTHLTSIPLQSLLEPEGDWLDSENLKKIPRDFFTEFLAPWRNVDATRQG
jgi:hypothetical protein